MARFSPAYCYDDELSGGSSGETFLSGAIELGFDKLSFDDGDEELVLSLMLMRLVMVIVMLSVAMLLTRLVMLTMIVMAMLLMAMTLLMTGMLMKVVRS